MELKYSKHKRPTFENFEAECPECNYPNIYNRVSDLDTIEPICFKTVICQECKKHFNINGDRISPKYQFLINECYKNIELKKYMNCILNICTAYETFFNLFLLSTLLIKPFFEYSIFKSIDQFNEIESLLRHRSKDYPFTKMRNIFISLNLTNKTYQTKDEIIQIIKNMPKLTKTIKDIKINEINDDFFRSYLLRLKNHKINEIRNQIIHKYAYRPSFEEVEFHLKESREIIFSLSARLELKKSLKYLTSI